MIPVDRFKNQSFVHETMNHLNQASIESQEQMNPGPSDRAVRFSLQPPDHLTQEPSASPEDFEPDHVASRLLNHCVLKILSHYNLDPADYVTKTDVRFAKLRSSLQALGVHINSVFHLSSEVSGSISSSVRRNTECGVDCTRVVSRVLEG